MGGFGRGICIEPEEAGFPEGGKDDIDRKVLPLTLRDHFIISPSFFVAVLNFIGRFQIYPDEHDCTFVSTSLDILLCIQIQSPNPPDPAYISCRK